MKQFSVLLIQEQQAKTEHCKQAKSKVNMTIYPKSPRDEDSVAVGSAITVKKLMLITRAAHVLVQAL